MSVLLRASNELELELVLELRVDVRPLVAALALDKFMAVLALDIFAKFILAVFFPILEERVRVEGTCTNVEGT